MPTPVSRAHSHIPLPKTNTQTVDPTRGRTEYRYLITSYQLSDYRV